MAFSGRIQTDSCLDCEYRGLRVFCNLSGESLQRFDAMGMHLNFPGRAVVFEEGQNPNGVFVVCTGQLKLSTTSREGRTMILRLAGAGDVLGLSATLNNQPYEVTAETLEPTQLKSMRRNEFLEFLETNAEAGQNTAKTLAREYREVFLDARRLALSGSAAARLGRLLLEWAQSASCGKPELRFTMALTHEELASMAGISRETVTRLLNQFERDQIIQRRGATISILSSEKLSLLAE